MPRFKSRKVGIGGYRIRPCQTNCKNNENETTVPKRKVEVEDKEKEEDKKNQKKPKKSKTSVTKKNKKEQKIK